MTVELEIYDVGEAVAASGSSKQSSIVATYDELVAVFGKDANIGSSDKATTEFRVEIIVRNLEFDMEDIVMSTIYDWKEESPDTCRTGEYTWNVGGFGNEAAWYIQDLLDEYRQQQIAA
jgi:hypothetical protein